MRFQTQILLTFCLFLTGNMYAQVVPVITGQTVNPIVINEDQSVALQVTDLIIDDSDSNFPGDFTLTASAGANYTLVGNTVTPDADYNGLLTVSVVVNDGSNDSAPFDVQIQVNAVNDAPSFVKGADPSINEDAGAQSIANWATSINKGAANESAQILTFTVTNDNNDLFSVQPTISSTGTLTYTLASNANGVANVTVVLEDDGGTANGGNDTFTTQNFIITVTAVNDEPSFVKGVDQTDLEDATTKTVVGWATSINKGAADESAQTLTFTVTNDNNGLFSTQPAINSAGTLTYTLAGNANGVATVTVALADNGGTANGGDDTSANQSFTITVTAVNDAPSFTKGADQTINEGAGAQTVIGWASVMSAGPTNESGQVLTFGLTNDNTALFSVQPSINATTGTLTYTPTAGISGLATVTVTLSDNGGTTNGGVNSNTQNFTITINAINDEPTFVKGADQTINEGAGAQTVVGWASSISAGPADESGQVLTFTQSNTNSALFTVQPAINVTTGTLTYTPAPNASGSATVTVTLTDNGGTANGGDDNSSQTFTITINPINDEPTFVKGADQTINEGAGAQTVVGWASSISAGPADESGQVLTFTQSNSNSALFTVQPAINATTGTLTYTPAANASGSATVTVTLTDNGGTANGGDDNSSQTFTITINPINDEPTFVKGADQTINEGAGAQTVVGWASSISAGPADESGQVLTFTQSNTNSGLFIVQPAINATTGTLTYTPAANASGSATVTVTLTDNGGTANGGDDNSSQTFTITINAINDEPTFVKGADQTINEGAGAQSVAGWASSISAGPADESGQVLTFTQSNTNSGLFTVQPAINATTGTLTYTPAVNASGSATITVTLTDNGGTANGGDDNSSQTFTITINPINDEPTFVKGGDQTINEGAGAQSVAGWATSISAGPADESGQVLTFSQSNTNSGLFTVQPAINATTGTLTYTPAANASGSATVTVTLTDNGGTANGGDDNSSQTFTITINSVNNEPSFAKGVDQTILEDATAQSIPGWATSISAGPADESGQSVTFNVSNNNNALFSVQPSVSPTGTLSYTPAANANGVATVSISLSDNGGTSNGGDDTSPIQTFTITITAVNDVPSFVKGGDQTVNEGVGVQTVAGWATGLSAGPANESGQTLSFNVTNNNNSLFSVQPSVNGTGTLTFTPAANAVGSATVTLAIVDNGGVANGGINTSSSQTFTITITGVNDEPSFVKGSNQTDLEDALAKTVANWATSISAGPSDESGQALIFTVTNDNNPLFSVQPAISPAGTLTYTLAANMNGAATVSVVLKDDGGTANGGDDTFITQTFTIVVTSVNDEPSFVKGSDQNLTEGAGAQSVSSWATSLSTGPANESAQTLSFTVTNNNNSLFTVQPAINTSGTLTFTPASNASGVATVTVAAVDNGGTTNGGDNTSASQTFTITITGINDEPSFVKGANQTDLEDAPAKTVTNWATSIVAGPADESGQSVTFTVSNDNNALFSVQPSISSTGTLTYTLASNMNGASTVSVILTDDGGTANGGDDTYATQTFTITVTAVNDEPSFVKGADQNLNEGAPAQTINNWATSISTGPANESAQTVSFNVTNSNNALFSVQPAISSTGTLTFTPTANSSGSATVTVILSDNGGVANGGDNTFASQTFTINVASINDAPSFVKGANQTDTEDAGAQTVAGWATSISKGPADESSQTLTFIVSNDNNALFSVQPAINATTGTLTYTPAANANGVANVSVVLTDNGGIANGGDDTSDAQTFTITITPVNDLPVITGQVALSTNEEQAITINLADLIVTDVDNSYPTGFTLTAFTGSNYTLSGTTVTPNSNFTGTLSVGVRVNDGGGNSNTFSLQITVGSVNDPPVITGQSSLNTNEDTPITLQLTNLIVTDPDNSFPTGFTLSVSSGSNYTVSGNTITPATNFVGILTVSVTVNDGTTSSNPFNVSITVNSVNDVPQITGQTPVSIAEVEPITITLSQLIVFDPDNNYPADFSLFVLSGSNYSVTGDVVTPVANFSGTLLVRVFVNDGTANSAIYNLQVLVNSTNDPPVITGQQAISTNEDQARVIQFSNLTVSDPDNTYPTGFTLTILPGANYTFTGTTVTPSLNFTGTLSVSVKVNDGTVDSAPFNLQLTVNPVNDAPVITGQSALATNEDTPITLQLSNLTVTDPDNTYPTGFSMTASAGTNYIVSGLQITPSLNFSGVLTVPVTVSDGALSSSTFNLSITVNAVNDVPVITAQTSLITQEEQPLTILLSNLTVTDVDDTYPTGFSLTLQAGTNYTASGGTLTPAVDFVGNLTVGVIVNDGSANSAVFNLLVQVVPSNDPPVITGQNAVSVQEDQSVTIQFSNLLVTDPDDTYPTGFTLTVSNGTNYTVSGTTVTPNTNFTGTLTVPVRVNDGVNNSNTYNLQVQVNPVNDAPVIIGQGTLATNEDQVLVLALANLTVTDPDNTYPTGFSLSVQSGTNYTVSGNTITPALNFNGDLNVNVTVSDGTATSAVFALVVKVNAVNDTPTKSGFATLNLVEDNLTEQTVNLLTVFSDVEDASSQLTYQITANDNPAFFQAIAINQAAGQLRFNLNANIFGTAKVTVRATDTGGLFVQDVLTINISGLNDAPSFATIANQEVIESTSPAQQTITITGISKGPNENAQELTFVASSGNTGIIPTPTILYSNGTTATLTYTPVANMSGSVVITVTAIDNGSSTAPNVNSFSQTFTIAVVEVNNQPTLNAITFGPISEDAAMQNVALAGITAGAGETTQTLTVSVTTNKPELFETLDVQYTNGQTTGTLRIKPKANAFGTATISVKVQDDGPNAPAPNSNSITRSFNLTINAVNDLPVFESTPVTNATVGVPYEYVIAVSDVDGDAIAITVPTKPAWLTLDGNKLSGTPPSDAAASNAIQIQAKDPTGAPQQQNFTISVNIIPVISSFSVNATEDETFTFSSTHFTDAFSDANIGQSLSKIKITVLPGQDGGTLRLGSTPIAERQEISISSLGTLTYQPSPNQNGSFTFMWSGSDGLDYSSVDATVTIVVAAVNDVPVITEIETEVLQYDISNEEPELLTTSFKAEDVDDEFLVSAEIRFKPQNFEPLHDRLLFTNTASITGAYNTQTGVLLLMGNATVTDYATAIKSIRYLYQDFTEINLTSKTVSISLTDDTQQPQPNTSNPKDRDIELIYAFQDLDIPNVFSPDENGYHDEWVIGIKGSELNADQFTEAVLRVFDKRGVLVFETIGFKEKWDGTFNGKPLPADTYFYIIDLKYAKIKYQNTITILRKSGQ